MPSTAKTPVVSAPIKVRLSVALSEVEWTRVRYALTHQFRMTREQAEKAMFDFRRRVQSIASWCWFQSTLSQLDNNIAAAIADVHGGDLVTLQSQRAASFGPVRIAIQQQLTLKPTFRNDGAGGCEIEVGLEWFNRVWRLRNKRDAVYFYCVSALGLLVLYLMAGALILYGAAIFLLFLADPELVMKLADGNLKIYLGLFGFLTGLAALTGNAVRYIWRRMFMLRR